MKEFRKTPEGLFICEECDHTFIKKDGLSKHVSNYHFSKKEYYDKWLKENEEGLCKICRKETEFTNSLDGYHNCCSIKCVSQYKHLRTQEEQLKKYGVKCLFSSKEKQEKSKQTKIQKYGDENYNNRNKSKKTCVEKYGAESYTQTENFKEKSKKTHINKYGVEYSQQNIDIHIKGEKTRFLIHKYLNTNIYYRSSYEYDFLEKYYSIFPDIQNAKSVKYKFKRKIKIYHPDFYIPSLNIIIEIKNDYLAKRDKQQIKAKAKATIANGFNYIMIIDKNYSEFNTFLTNHGTSKL